MENLPTTYVLYYCNQVFLEELGIIFEKNIEESGKIGSSIISLSAKEQLKTRLIIPKLYEQCKESLRIGLMQHFGTLEKTGQNWQLKNGSYEYDLSLKESIDDENVIIKEKPEVIVFGQFIGKSTIKVGAIFALQEQFLEKGSDSKIIPVCIPGLDKLLFPEKQLNGIKGFENPKNAPYTVPRIVLVKGAPGTGKTTMAIQMLTGMAKSGFNCVYWSTNDNKDIIIDIVRSYGFYSTKEIDKYFNEDSKKIIIKNFQNKTLPEFQIKKLSEDSVSEKTDVLFIDSLNIDSGKKIERETIWKLFETYKKQKLLVFVFLEDYGDRATNESQQLLADCEFLSDIVIQLAEKERHKYHTWELKVVKKHFGSQAYGWHLYKISKKDPVLSSLNKNKGRGITVYPSIHRYLSGSRYNSPYFESKDFVHTGITHIDYIMQGEGGNVINSNTMPPDSCIVIRGEKGGHKLPLGLNILLGGLWKVEDKKIKANNDVLLILLDEEANIDIPKSAMAYLNHLFTGSSVSIETKSGQKSLDNGNIIKWRNSTGSPKLEECKKNCKRYNLCTMERTYGQKVFFKKFCANIDENDDQHVKVLIAGFRPGCIMPEEFLDIVTELIDPKNNISNLKQPEPAFSRVLFVSTAHLQMRFPLLNNELLFLPALVDLFKSQRIISIFIDVEGEGSNKNLTFGLSELADYLIRIENYTENDKKKFSALLPSDTDKSGKLLPENFQFDEKNYLYSKMLMENVRGKVYLRKYHLVTVGTHNGNNSLYIFDIKDLEDPYMTSN